MNIDSVIFDMDGVLVDSEEVMREAAMAGLAEYGVHADPEDFTEFVGMGEDLHVGGVAEKHGVPYRTEMKDRVYEIYVDIVDGKLRIMPGAPDTLKNLHDNGIAMAIASSADRIKVEANLRVAGIALELLKAIVTGEDVERKKPAPDIFLTAAEQMGALPEACCVVEDAVSGIQAAKSAGMKCIAITSSFSREELAQHSPDAICAQTSEVYHVLQQWNRSTL